MKITKFEDLKVWQLAREIVNNIYKITNKKRFKYYELNSQIRRAAISIMSNIAEGFNRFSNREFVHFLNISISSAVEVKSQLYIAIDQNYISETEFNNISDKLDECTKMCSGLIKHLLKYPGNKPSEHLNT